LSLKKSNKKLLNEPPFRACPERSEGGAGGQKSKVERDHGIKKRGQESKNQEENGFMPLCHNYFIVNPDNLKNLTK